jgi:hypothetical protein
MRKLLKNMRCCNTDYYIIRRISGFHSGGYGEYRLLRYDPEDEGDMFLRNAG